MPVSLYELSVPTYLQTLGAVEAFMAKGLAHFNEHKIDPAEIVETRLFPDMAPFRFQVLSVAHHSVAAIEAVKSGLFSPPGKSPDLDYAALQKVITDARATIQSMKPDEINAREGKDTAFKFHDMTMPFTAENFILSFSLPNFHFHATTAYDILRSKGVPIGKRDYMGRPRMKM